MKMYCQSQDCGWSYEGEHVGQQSAELPEMLRQLVRQRTAETDPCLVRRTAHQERGQMTVAELIEKLKKYPPDATICRQNQDYGSEERYESNEAVDVERVVGPGEDGNYLQPDAVVLM